MERLHHYYDSLGISLENTDNDVDRVVLSTQDIPVKTNIMNQITDRINKLEQLIESRQNTISAYNAEISNLWKLLQTSQNDIDQFFAHCPTTVSDDAISYYQQYIMSLHEEVKSKLRELIPEIRGGIQQIIDYVRYYSSILDTWNFSILSVPEDQFTMELFEQHNELYDQLVDAKNDLDPIVEQIDRREKMLDLQEELEQLLKDPRRYTDKRNGSKLLQRQMLLQKEVKELPKIVRDLIMLISDYEKEKGSIYINGEHFIDILRQEEDELRPRSTVSSVYSVKSKK